MVKRSRNSCRSEESLLRDLLGFLIRRPAGEWVANVIQIGLAQPKRLTLGGRIWTLWAELYLGAGLEGQSSLRVDLHQEGNLSFPLKIERRQIALLNRCVARFRGMGYVLWGEEEEDELDKEVKKMFPHPLSLPFEVIFCKRFQAIDALAQEWDRLRDMSLS